MATNISFDSDSDDNPDNISEALSSDFKSNFSAVIMMFCFKSSALIKFEVTSFELSTILLLFKIEWPIELVIWVKTSKFVGEAKETTFSNTAWKPGLIISVVFIPSVSIIFPGTIPKVLSGPGPNNKTVLSFSELRETINSVPLTPKEPFGIFTSSFSGFFSLIFPEIVLTIPDFILVTKFPSFVIGLYIKSSIVSSVFSPTVITVSSKNSIWAFDLELAKIVSP